MEVLRFRVVYSNIRVDYRLFFEITRLRNFQIFGFDNFASIRKYG